VHGRNLISIWFFIGVLLLIYGIAILGSGLLAYGKPPARTVVLGELNAPIWWGALLLVIGAFYTYRFSPRRKQ
jgi:hypothetical protein